jgi:putative tricarboxylic transport membrane protein
LFRLRELKSGLFFFGLSVFTLWESLRAGLGTLREPGSGFLSFCAGVALSALSVVLICRGWSNREKLDPHSRRVLLAMVTLFVYSLVLEILGFLIATFLLVAILLQIGASRRWWIQLGMSAVMTFLVYLVFGIWLHVYFPKGFLMI